MRGNRNVIELRPIQNRRSTGHRKPVYRIFFLQLSVYQGAGRHSVGTIPKRPGIQSGKGEPLGLWATEVNRLKAMQEQDVFSRGPDLWGAHSISPFVKYVFKAIITSG